MPVIYADNLPSQARPHTVRHLGRMRRLNAASQRIPTCRAASVVIEMAVVL